MPLINQFYMDLDLKRRFERFVATFRTGDNVELIMSIFNDGKEFDISSANNATIYQKTCSGTSLKGQGTFDTIDGKRVVRYTLDKLYTIETGFNTMMLVLDDGEKEISIQPFSIYINDDLTSVSGSYIELIQDLMKQVEALTLELNNTIKLEEKGVANGVATLDENGKIPESQIPEMFSDFLEHIPQTVFKHQVHGMRINGDGILQHETEPNTWVDTGIGGGGNSGGNEDFLNVYIKVEKGIVNLEYVGVPSVTSQKWSTGEQTQSYFNTNGTLFTGNSFGVSQPGAHTLWYKDSNGNTYTKVFEVKNEDLDVTEVTIEIQDGVVTVTPDKPISLKKWALGQRDIAYFQNEGNIFTGNSFEINVTGTYTVYLKDTNGIESVHVFMANAFDLRDYFTVNVVNGVATITYLVPVLEEHTKWSKGLQNESYFEGNGTPVVNSTFNVTEIGDYTVRIATDPDRIVRLGAFKVTEDMLKEEITDNTPPLLDINEFGNYKDGTKNGAVSLAIFASDSESGLSHMILPNGTRVDNPPYETEYNITTNGNHTFKLYDKAGNESTKTINVTCIGTEVNVSSQPIGSKFYFCGQEFVVVDRVGSITTIVQNKNQNTGFHRVTFDYDNITNLFANASIKSYIVNNFSISGTLKEEDSIIPNAQWNYGTVTGADENWSHSTNITTENYAGLLTVPQMTKALNNNWIEYSDSEDEWTISPSSTPGYYNAVHTVSKNSYGFINVRDASPNDLRSFRLAYQVDNTAKAYK